MSEQTTVDGSGAETTPTDEGRKSPQGSEKTAAFNKGYGEGAHKARADLAKDFGVGLGELEGIAKQYKEKVETDKSTEHKLAELQTQHKDLTAKFDDVSTQLKGFLEAERAKADELYNKLSDEDKKVVDDTGLPREKQFSLLQRMVAEPSPKNNSTTRRSGSGINPTGTNNTDRDQGKGSFMKDKKAYWNANKSELMRSE